MPWAAEPEELPLLEPPLELLLPELLEPPELLDDELLLELPPLELPPPELDEPELLLLLLLPQALSAHAAIAMNITLRIKPPKPGPNSCGRAVLAG